MRFRPLALAMVALLLGCLTLNQAWAQGDTSAYPVRRLLCISQTPETKDLLYQNGTGTYLHVLEHFLSPKTILAGTYHVEQVGWLEADKALAQADNYAAVILWECPARITDSRDSDPHYRNLEVISPATAGKLVQYVRGGGALIVAGGVTNYGDGHPTLSPPKKLGLGQAAKGAARSYHGYAGTPLAEILPVEVPAGRTLTALKGGARAVVAASELTEGLDLTAWPFEAYHKVKPAADSQVLARTSGGDPLVATRQVGKGRVLAVTAAPRANVLFGSKRSPTWPDEGAFWSRAVSWAITGKADASGDAAARQAYAQALAALGPKPLELTLGDYPYGAHVFDAAMPLELGNLSFKYYSQMGLNHVVMQRTPLHDPAVDAFLARYAAGLEAANMVAYLHPALAGEVRRFKIDPNDYAQKVLPSGQLGQLFGMPNPSPFSPIILKHAVQAVHQFMPIVAKYPRLAGMFHDDEWAWTLSYRHPYIGGQGIGDYSQAALDRYKALTGKDAPPPVYREMGYVAPENDPWLKWCQLIRQDSFKNYNDAIKRAVMDHKQPGQQFLLCNYPGGFEGNLDIMMEEVYLDYVFSSELATMERMDVRPNFRQDSRRTKYPMWALVGIFRSPEDKSMYPESFRLTMGLCLGGGAKGIILWNSANLWMPQLQHPGRDGLAAEASRLGAYLEKFGHMFLQLEKSTSDAWMLSGWFWVNSFDNYYHLPPDEGEVTDKETPWLASQITDIAGPAAMRSGMYTEFVTEKQLMSDEIFTKKAVFLPGLMYCRQGVIDKLQQYIARGGKVYTDQSSKVEIPGARIMPVDLSLWHQDIAAGRRPKKQPTEENYRQNRARREDYIEAAIPHFKNAAADALGAVRLDSTDAAYSLMENGATKYLFVYNSNVDKANRVGVTWIGMGAIYDVEQGRQAPVCSTEAGVQGFDVDLPAGGWKVFALTPSPVAGVSITGAALVSGKLDLAVQVTDAQGKALDGAVPLEIVINGAQGGMTVHRSTSRGVLKVQLPASQAKSVSVRELFAGNAAEKNL